MATHFYNLEPSGFAHRRGEWVGYADGVWRVTRTGAGWQASERDGTRMVFGRTLADISAALTEAATHA